METTVENEYESIPLVIEYAIDRIEQGIEDGSIDDLDERLRTAADGLRRLLRFSSYFKPGEWLTNAAALRPIAGRSERLPAHVRWRLKAAYESFMFGTWIAAIATCRALLEYALVDRASTLRMDPCRPDDGGRTKPLRELIELAGTRVPELAEDMESVRDYGNVVMHPRRVKGAVPLILGRTQALDCIQRTRRIVASLYGGG